jgi:peptide-methionine (S)-S-oxide reductase
MTRPDRLRSALIALPCVLALGCSQPSTESSDAGPARTEPAAQTPKQPMTEPDAVPSNPPAAAPASEELATFGAGCFWCTEAVLEQLDGVIAVDSGYMGGDVPNPTYKAVCTGTTGHAEVVQVRFDPSRISYDVLLAWFWKLHDPTTLNRQGADVGTQYRSVIFTHSEEQRVAAEASKAAHAGDFADPIVTEITAASEYYPAEGYHQDYYRGNKSQGYCRAVIAPKLDKLGLEK